MADNTTLNTGSGGDTLATDDIGGVKYPRSKIVIGADGTNDGDVSSANPLPVDLGTNNDVTVTNATAANLKAEVVGTGTFTVQVDGAALTSLQLIDNIVSGAGVNVSQIGGAAAPIGAGLEATALRVTLATDSTGVISVDDNGGSLTVDGPLTDTELRATAVPVSLASVPSHAVTNAGTFAVQAAQSGTWNVGTVTAVTAISNALPTGTNTIGNVNVPSVATGGATPGKLISAATTNATSVKASAGTLYSLTVMNTNASARYFKLYNKASAPTVGTDTPVQVFTIPGNTAGAGFVVPIPTCGIAFSTGIAFATTTGAADSDTAAVAANEIVISYSYK